MKDFTLKYFVLPLFIYFNFLYLNLQLEKISIGNVCPKMCEMSGGGNCPRGTVRFPPRQ